MATRRERLVSKKPAKPGSEPTMWVFRREVWRRDAGGVTSTRIDPDLAVECAEAEEEPAGYDRSALPDNTQAPHTPH